MLDCTPSAATLPDIASKRFGRTRVLDAARFARSARRQTARHDALIARMRCMPCRMDRNDKRLKNRPPAASR
ncbi:hypothetical protein DF057_16400 [Burkholderia cepacia]|nr:hypothetical protein DF057_16400 [Burkholderia cepacia]